MEEEPSYIHLNVGGMFYTTSLLTLTHCPDSMLAVMFNQENIPLAKDETGRYIIDRDGATFRYVLNFLRGGNLNLPPTFSDYYQLKEEIEFYQLNDMKELLELWRMMNWKEAEPATNYQPDLRYDPKTEIGHVSVSFQPPKHLSVYKTPTYVARFSPKVLLSLAGLTYRQTTQIKLATKPDDDLISFRYMHNYIRGKGNHMPNSQKELQKLRKAADFYDIHGLRDELNPTTTFFPTLKFTQL